MILVYKKTDNAMITTVGIFSNKTDADAALVELRASGMQKKETSRITAASAKRFMGMCARLGINNEDVMRFQEYLRGGDILILVRLATSKSKDIFTRTHAREIQEYAQ